MRKSQKPIFKPDSPEEKNIQPTFGPKQRSVRGSKDVPADQRSVSGKATIFLFVGLHHTFWNFKVRRSEKK